MSPTNSSAERWNAVHPPGTQVIAYPGKDGEPLYTWTRSLAMAHGRSGPVVLVEGHVTRLPLSHVDVGPWTLTPENYGHIDEATDRDNTFAKQYTAHLGGQIVTVGMRIGERPARVIARFGDVIVRHGSGVYTVRSAKGSAA
ncbi:hypothetical protein ACFV5N_09355 [Streptomyces sp. NPDC059853]|uniref:hypothetical protein n=1 Tax=Streptomyces sp. NPDC059853 TaxID=3346973 RepID=UPI0036537DE6